MQTRASYKDRRTKKKKQLSSGCLDVMKINNTTSDYDFNTNKVEEEITDLCLLLLELDFMVKFLLLLKF